jgi:hypothetical protein
MPVHQSLRQSHGNREYCVLCVHAVPPDAAGLTAEKLREEGIFLWENGAEAILWLGPRVPLALQQALIGVYPFHDSPIILDYCL